MMNEHTCSRNYEENYNRNHCGNRGKRCMDCGDTEYEAFGGRQSGDTQRQTFYQTYQVPLMILGSFLSGVLLIIGALA